MNDHYEPGPSYRWADDFRCPFQLLGEFFEWFLSGSGLDQLTPISDAVDACSDAVWSANGSALALTPERGKLKILELDPGSVVPSSESLLTFEDEKKQGAVMQSGCFTQCGDLFFYSGLSITGLDEIATKGRNALRLLPEHQSVWLLPAMSKEPVLVLDEPLSVFSTVHMTEAGPILLSRNHPEPGHMQVIHLLTHECRAYQLANENCFLVQLSDSGDCCHFGTVGENEELDLWTFTFSSQEVRAQGRASSASWSPDQQTIAAVREDKELVLIDTTTGQTETVLSISGEENIRSYTWSPEPPVWSPNGEWLHFSLPEKPAKNHMNDTEPQYPTDHASFVANVRYRTIVQIPFHLQGCVWRPKG